MGDVVATVVAFGRGVVIWPPLELGGRSPGPARFVAQQVYTDDEDDGRRAWVGGCPKRAQAAGALIDANQLQIGRAAALEYDVLVGAGVCSRRRRETGQHGVARADVEG